MADVNLMGNNSRIAQIRKFVTVPPKRGHVMKLLTVEDPPQTIGEWQRDECVDNANQALAVDMLLQEHAIAEEGDVTAMLWWLAQDGSNVTSKKLHCRLERPDDSPEVIALGIDGKERGVLQQTQMHLHVVISDMHSILKTTNTAIATCTTQQSGIIRDLAAMVRDLYVERHNLQERNAQLVEEAGSARAMAAEEHAAEKAEQEGAESAARAGMVKALTGAVEAATPVVVPMLLRLVTGGEGSDEKATG